MKQRMNMYVPIVFYKSVMPIYTLRFEDGGRILQEPDVNPFFIEIGLFTESYELKTHYYEDLSPKMKTHIINKYNIAMEELFIWFYDSGKTMMEKEKIQITYSEVLNYIKEITWLDFINMTDKQVLNIVSLTNKYKIKLL